MKSEELKRYLAERKALVDEALSTLIPAGESGPAAPLFEAMRYSVEAGGKRVRPILLMAAAEASGGRGEDYINAAGALECVHTYSLIHDDLPAMDDDDLRRGQPTCHKVFGEAMAILAGDGLLTYAFELMTSQELVDAAGAPRVMKAISILAGAAGLNGMVAGQAADILHEGKGVDGPTLEYIHSYKTGALLTASVTMGAVLAGADAETEKRLKAYGQALGLCFQIVDDLLDIEGDQEVLGKPVGSDQAANKATYPAIHGVEKARQKARSLGEQAQACLVDLGERAAPLISIAKYIVERDH